MCQAEQDLWISWKSIERKKLRWRKLWGRQESCIRLIMDDTCDVRLLQNRIGFSMGLSRPALVVFLLRAAELCRPPPFCCPLSVYVGRKMYLCL